MTNENVLRNAFWLYSVIVGLSIEEALKSVIPQIFALAPEQRWEFIPAALRLFLFLVLIIRFYLGAAFFFEKVYFSEKASEYPKKSYNLDFLFGLIHFLIFFALAISIESQQIPRRVFQVLLSVTILYDVWWYIASRKYDTRKLIKLWTVVNVITFITAAAFYLSVYSMGYGYLRAEEAAFVPIFIVSVVDIAELALGKMILAEWLRDLTDSHPGSNHN
jgi:hypothetical protein